MNNEEVGPLALSLEFDPELFMHLREVDGGQYHSVVRTASLPAKLVANGSSEEIELAEKILGAVIQCQERKTDDPHLGNFWWEREDGHVEDLNCVQFVLYHFIPMMIQFGDRLSPKIRCQVLEAIKLGLDELRRIDVHPLYSNIVVKDIVNSCLGGELLNDEETANRGYGKLSSWIAFTNNSGTVYEYNSLPYTAHVVEGLHTLAELTSHEATRIRSTTILARMGLSAALHIHKATGRWSGPYGRAYKPTVFCENEAECKMLERWLDQELLPPWIGDVLRHSPTPSWVKETADVENGLGISTYHSASFSMGVATRELSSQANRFIASQSGVLSIHYIRKGQNRPGVVFSRYLLDDKWLGDYRTTPSRTRFQVLPEEGRFYGAQDGPRAVGIYAPMALGAISTCISAKAVVVWTQLALIDKIWVNGDTVGDLPVPVPEGATIVVASGDVLVAVVPLSRTNLGRNAPVRLAEIDGHLSLEVYNYLGPRKTFWEMAVPGAFYQGQPKCGFYLEVAERCDYRDGGEFGKVVASGVLKDLAQPLFTYRKGKERLWTVTYARGDGILGIEVDLMDWKLKRRWNQNGDMAYPMLDSPVAKETNDGRVTLGDASLTCGKSAAWLCGCPGTGRWIAGYHGPQIAPLLLTVPGGSVAIEAIEAGIVVWDNGRIFVEGIGLRSAPVVRGGRLSN